MKKFTEEDKKKIAQEVVKIGRKYGFPNSPKKDSRKKK